MKTKTTVKVIRLVKKIDTQLHELLSTDLKPIQEARIQFLNKIALARRGEGPMIA